MGEVQNFLTLNKTSPSQRVLLVSAFGRISPMDLGLHLLKINVVGSIVVEPLAKVNRASKPWFPNSQCYNRIENVSLGEVQSWTRKVSNCDMISHCLRRSSLLGSLWFNASQQGAVLVKRSSLAANLVGLGAQAQATLCRAKYLVFAESVSSMDTEDLLIYSEYFDLKAVEICCSSISPCKRNELY